MAIPVRDAFPLVGDPLIDGLADGSAWTFEQNNRVLTYSFSVNDSPNGAWTPALQNLFRLAFAEWAKVINVRFIESGSGGVFTQSTADIAVTPVGADLPGPEWNIAAEVPPNPEYADTFIAGSALGSSLGVYTRSQYRKPEGDIFFKEGAALWDSFPQQGGYPSGIHIALHAIGQALGLKDVEDSGTNNRPNFIALGVADAATFDNTLMTRQFEEAVTVPSGEPSSPMLLDILVAQRMYGANMAHNTGNDTYRIDAGRRVVWDAGGVDTFDATRAPRPVLLDLEAGAFSRSPAEPGSPYIDINIGIAYNVRIENATGSRFGDVIFGNDAANLIDGGRGLDVMAGGKGNDSYVVSDADDRDGATVLHLEGAPGAGVATGEHAFGRLDGEFEVLLDDRSADGVVDTLTLSYRDHLPYGGNWYFLTLSSWQTGHGLTPGTYLNAERAAFATAGRPGLDLGGNGHGANQVFGSFTVHVAEYDYSGSWPTLLRFAADFQIHAEKPDAPPIAGTFRYNYGGIIGAPEVVLELPNEGNDTVRSSIGYTLPANVENLLLTGTRPNAGTGNGLANVITGNSADNVLSGLGGNDQLNGAAGDDLLSPGLGTNMVDGGVGSDTVDYSSATFAFAVSLPWGRANGDSLDTLINIENVIGSPYADFIYGSNYIDNRLEGGGGNDQLWGLSGGDTLLGGAGNDLLAPGLGNNLVDGGSGTDTVDYSGSSYALQVSLPWARASGEGLDTLSGVENVIGSGFADEIYGTNYEDNRLEGGAGNDRVWGLSGDDTLLGGAGNDFLAPGLGNNMIDGGEGSDTVDYSSSAHAVQVSLPWARASGEGLDTLSGVENVIGSSFADEIYGTNYEDNRLEGGAGNDYLWGLSGADVLVGGSGQDTLSGGSGTDRFEYNNINDGRDHITDFTRGVGGDVLDIRDTLVGYNPATSNINSFVRLAQVGGDTSMSVNADGSGSDFVLLATLVGVTGATLGDMVAQGNLLVF